jgi:hypothetical protein
MLVRMMSLRTPLFVLAAALMGTAAAATAATSVAALRTVFDESLTRIETATTAKSRAWPDDYENTLKAIQQNAQKAGRFEEWTATSNEIKRFRETGDIPDEVLAASPESLRAIQKQALEKRARIQQDRHKNTLALTRKYTERLSGLLKTLTIQGDMVEASAVNDELKRIKELPQVVTAQEAQDTAEPKPEARPGGTGVEPADESDTPAPAADTPEARPARDFSDRASRDAKEDVDEEFKLYHIGENPSSRMPMKSTSLFPTERLRLCRKISASLTAIRLTDTDRDAYDSFFSFYHVRRGTTTQAFRLNLRSAQSSAAYSNAVVMLQYFIRDLGRGNGRIDPIETDVRYFRVPLVNATGIWLDCPPISTRAETTVDACYDGYRALNNSSRTGEEFYGLAVSVFGSDGALLSQGCTNPNLGRFAPATPPKSLRRKNKSVW